MERHNREEFDPQKHGYVFPLHHHYKLRMEFPLSMTAAAFFKAVQKEAVEDVLSDKDLEYGASIELDDGLKPYYFYYFNYSTIVPAMLFTPPKATAK